MEKENEVKGTERDGEVIIVTYRLVGKEKKWKKERRQIDNRKTR